VGDSNAGVVRRERPGQGRIGVTVDEHPVRPFDLDRRPDAGPHSLDHLFARQRAAFQPVGRLAQPELLEEELRELAVVVLAGVQHDLLDSGLLQRG
jgi:hypothetical protein